MANPLTPIRIARAQLNDVSNIEQQQEIDFDLSERTGIELLAVRFGATDLASLTGGTAPELFALMMELHAETGTLEAALDEGSSGDIIFDSEVLAWAITHFGAHIDATNGDATTYLAHSHLEWNYQQMLGRPLLIANNPTFVAEAQNTDYTWGEVFVWLYYRLVELTQQELAGLFLRRR